MISEHPEGLVLTGVKRLHTVWSWQSNKEIGFPRASDGHAVYNDQLLRRANRERTASIFFAVNLDDSCFYLLSTLSR